MPIVEILAVVVGVGLLLVARVHRVKARQLRRQVLRRALASEDPAVRRAAIQVAGDEGLASSVELFLGLLRRERDRSVLLALAQVVVRNQWEPAKASNMIKLRLWAHRYLEEAAMPSWQPERNARANRYQGPTVGDVVNLLLQPTDKRPSERRPRQARPQPDTPLWRPSGGVPDDYR